MSAVDPFLLTPRVEPLVLKALRDTLPEVTCGSVKPDLELPCKQVVVGATPQQMETPVTRWVALRLEVYALREDGTGDIDAEYRLANRCAQAIHDSLPIGPIWDAQIAGGPVKQLDAGGTIIAYMTMQLRVSLKHQ